MTRFTCDKIKLSEALNNVSKAVSDRSALSALEGIKFSIRQNNLELTGYDLEIGIRTNLEIRSADSADFIVNSPHYLRNGSQNARR